MEEHSVQMKAQTDTANVLVVDDERDIADLYSMWLGEEYETTVAYDGSEALEHADEATDVVFLDRQMPGLSGDEVLDRVAERGLDCRVVMVTAVDPDFDIVDMPFDDYMTKPVSREDLVTLVEVLCYRAEYDDRSQRFFSLASKKAALEASEATDTEEYEELVERVEAVRAEVDATLDRLSAREAFVEIAPDAS